MFWELLGAFSYLLFFVGAKEDIGPLENPLKSI
jgi:hypothetical protein